LKYQRLITRVVSMDEGESLMSCIRALVASGSLLLSLVAGGAADAAVNPLGIAFKSSTNVSLYAKTTGLVVTGRCNRYDSAFTNVHNKGGEVLAYLDAVEVPGQPMCALDTGFYMNSYSAVPLWPYPSYGVRIQYSDHRLADLRKGSKWSNYVVSYVEKLMRENKVDGVFLDCVGARLWSSVSNWNNWPQWEKDAWTDGNIDLVRRIDVLRRQIRPTFIVLGNNIWDRGNGDTRGFAGEKYVDGVVLEHASAYSSYHKAYAKRAFSNLGQRRVLVVAKNTTEALVWASQPGVTHVSNQATSQYGYPLTPVVSFHYLGDR
jgi:hypothetical protein